MNFGSKKLLLKNIEFKELQEDQQFLNHLKRSIETELHALSKLAKVLDYNNISDSTLHTYNLSGIHIRENGQLLYEFGDSSYYDSTNGIYQSKDNIGIYSRLEQKPYEIILLKRLPINLQKLKLNLGNEQTQHSVALQPLVQKPLYLSFKRTNKYEYAAYANTFIRWTLAGGILIIALAMIYFQKEVLGRINRLHKRIRLDSFIDEEFYIDPKKDEIAMITEDVFELLKRTTQLSEDLQYSESRFMHFMMEKSEFVCHFNRYGKISFVNQSYCQFFKLERDELVGTKIDHSLHPWSIDIMERALSDKRIKSKQKLRVKFLIGNGEIGWLEWQWNPVFTDDGKLKEIHASGRDITVYKNIEDSYRNQKEFEKMLLALTTRFINMPIKSIDEVVDFTLSEIGKFTKSDRAFIYHLNESSTMLIKSHAWFRDKECLHLDAEIEMNNWYEHAIDKQEMICLSTVSQIPECEERKEIISSYTNQQIKSRIMIPMIQNGRSNGFIGFDCIRSERQWAQETENLLMLVSEMVMNADEKQKARRLLEENQQHLKQLMSGIPAGMILIDSDSGKVEDANPMACHLLKATKDTILTSDYKNFFKNIEEAKGHFQSAEDILQTFEGDEIAVVYSLSNIKMNGQKKQIFCFMDIREQKKLEEERLNNERLAGVLDSMRMLSSYDVLH
ncbi:MAG: PAS domain S-box protein [Lentisphaeria bacterium]|nr:PAS domain S-box protein [Lentisphaeria bacterium]